MNLVKPDAKLIPHVLNKGIAVKSRYKIIMHAIPHG